VTAADFNGDGIPDLAVLSDDSNGRGLSILLGNGDGTFLAKQTIVTTVDMPGDVPMSVVVGDFNGDGIPDLALGEYSGHVAVLLGNGDGTFQTPTEYCGNCNSIASIAVGDFNLDGRLDLAVTTWDDVVTVLLGNGDGTFQMGGAYAVGNGASGIAVGDFNGDGKLDVAVANTNDGTVSILLGNGDGTFQAQKTLPAGAYPTSLAVGDFRQNGKLDLVVGDVCYLCGIGVLLGNGDGTFQAAQPYAANGPITIVVGDFNGDGKPDLAFADYDDDEVGLLLGKGDGTFQPGTAFSLNFSSFAMAAGDFNGDGTPDLAVVPHGTSTLDVLLNGWTAQATASTTGPIGGSATHAVLANYSGDSDFAPSSSSTVNLNSMAESPIFSIAPGTYTTPQSVTISDATAGSIIYYTANGTTPTISSAVYSAPITVSLTETIQAIASGNGYSASAVASAAYTITPPAETPTFSVAAGTYTAAQTVTISDVTAGSIIYYTTNGITPTTSSTVYSGPITVSSTETIQAVAIASGHTLSSVGSAAYTINLPNPLPVVTSISPTYTTSGSSTFTLKVGGSGFISGSTVYWGTAALTTQYVSAMQLTASVPAADIASVGITTISVQTPTPGGGTSNTLQVEIDSAGTGSGTAPSFTSPTASVAAGSTASYPVTLPTSATSVSASCLNLPTGTSCSYSASSGAVTITTSPSTPKGTYQITVVFSETLPGSTSAFVILPFLLLPLLFIRRKMAGRGAWFTACIGLILLAGVAAAVGCGGSSSATATNPTHQVNSSGTVSLTVQ
jgi:hypothetical protein